MRLKPKLFVVESDRRDMPPFWDSRRVEWSEWKDQLPTSMRFHGKPQLCACGVDTEDAVTCHGTVHPLEGELFKSTGTRTLKSGRKYPVEVDVPAWPTVYLAAFRCECDLDVVINTRTQECWELDASDYGPKGSTYEASA